MNIKTSNFIKSVSVAVLIMAQSASQSAWAHARWIVPSHTNLTGEKPHTITVDMSISNDLFAPTHGFLMQSKGSNNPYVTPAELVMLTPDNKMVKDIPFVNFDIKAVGKVSLSQKGTHHIRLMQSPVYFTTYDFKNGVQGKAFGKAVFSSSADAKVPEGVTNIQRVKYIPTLDTFVSRNGTSKTAYFNQGLEIKTSSHPNDFFVGETTKFQLYLNGDAITKSSTIDVVRGGTRHRNDRDIQSITSNDSGWFEVEWQSSGMYLIETEYSVPSNDEGIDLDTHSMFSTFEVNPM